MVRLRIDAMIKRLINIYATRIMVKKSIIYMVSWWLTFCIWMVADLKEIA